MMPEVNNVYSLDVQHKSLGLYKRYVLAKKIKDNSYSSSIILPNSFKSAIISWLLNIPMRIGYTKELRSILLTKKHSFIKHEDNMSNRYLKLAGGSYSNNIRPSLTVDVNILDIVKKKYQIDDSKKNIVLCPEAEYGTAKRWPTKKWSDLAISFKHSGYKVYFLGKSKDLESDYKSIFNSNRTK